MQFQIGDIVISNNPWLISMIGAPHVPGVITYVGLYSSKVRLFTDSEDITLMNDYIDKIKLKKPNIENLYEFTNATYRESRDKDGKLSFIEPKKILEKIKDCEVINLKDNKLVKISELL